MPCKLAFTPAAQILPTLSKNIKLNKPFKVYVDFTVGTNKMLEIVKKQAGRRFF